MTDYSNPDIVFRTYMSSFGAIRIISENGIEITSVASPAINDTIEMHVGVNEQFALVEENGIPQIMLEIPTIWNDGNVVKFQLIQQLNDVA